MLSLKLNLSVSALVEGGVGGLPLYKIKVINAVLKIIAYQKRDF